MAKMFALLACLCAMRVEASLSIVDSTIVVNGNKWFHEGNISVTVDQKVFSTRDASLKAAGSIVVSSGADTLGKFTSKTQKWLAGNTAFTTSTREYGGKFVIFTQTFPQGAQGTMRAGKRGDVSSCFPSIDPAPADGKPRGFVSWQGRFLEGSHGGSWTGSRPGVGTGDAGGPFVVFGQPMNESLVFSAASNFMTNTVGRMTDFGHGGEASFCFGLDAPVASVPPGYALETIVFLGKGVNSVTKHRHRHTLARPDTHLSTSTPRHTHLSTHRHMT